MASQFSLLSSSATPIVESPPASSPLLTSSQDPPPLSSDLDISIAHPISTYVSYSSLPHSLQSFITSVDSITIPKTIQRYYLILGDVLQ